MDLSRFTFNEIFLDSVILLKVISGIIWTQILYYLG